MNYEDMSDFEINSLVIRILLRGQFIEYHEQEVDELLEAVGFDGASSVARFTTRLGSKQQFDGCNNPSDAWPIIIENNISMLADSDYALDRKLRKFKLNFTGRYVASAFPVMSDSFNGDEVQSIDKNPLRAAMICFLKKKDAEK